jgi:hypothetical protein
MRETNQSAKREGRRYKSIFQISLRYCIADIVIAGVGGPESTSREETVAVFSMSETLLSFSIAISNVLVSKLEIQRKIIMQCEGEIETGQLLEGWIVRIGVHGSEPTLSKLHRQKSTHQSCCSKHGLT